MQWPFNNSIQKYSVKVIIMRNDIVLKEVLFDETTNLFNFDILLNCCNSSIINWQLLTRYYLQVAQEHVFGRYQESHTQSSSPS